MITPSDICYVTNHDTKALVLKYNGQKYVIEPNQRVSLPAAAAFLWFGDPRTSGSTPSFIRNEQGAIQNMLPSRTQEITRLRFKYGADLGGDEISFENVDLPKVTVTTLDGDEVIMVIHDPEGNHSIPVAAPIGGDSTNAQLYDMVQKQQRMIDLLLRKMDGYPDEARDESELPTDDAETVRQFKSHDLTKGIPGPTLSEVTK